MLPSASIRPTAIPNLRPLAAILLATALLGFVTGFGLGRLDLTVPRSAQVAATPTFDAVGFRAGERAPLAAPTFDAVGFRAGERASLVTPTFDTGAFFAGERQPLTAPAAP